MKPLDTAAFVRSKRNILYVFNIYLCLHLAMSHNSSSEFETTNGQKQWLTDWRTRRW